MKRTSAMLIAVLVGAAAPAARAGGGYRPIDVPGFATLDRMDGQSRWGIDGGLTFFDNRANGGNSAHGLRLDLHGQYVGQSGFGGYACVPVSWLLIDNANDQNGVGNIEGGVLYAIPAGQNFDVILRGGLTLPTANTDQGSLANILAGYGRITDIALAAPQTTWARLSASPVVRSGRLFFRLDAGVDAPISSDVNADSLLRLNVGVGFDTGTVAVAAELANVFDAGNTNSAGDNSLSTLAVSAQFGSGSTVPMVALVLPLNNGVNKLIQLIAELGVESTF